MLGAGNQQERLSSEERLRWFVAGVVEGEGSVCVCVKKHPTAPLGYIAQPEFFVYQHRLRRSLLELTRRVFEAGRIVPKPGNPDVLALMINSRPVLSRSVVPFLERYMTHSSRKEDYERFTDVVWLIEEGLHRTPAGLATIVEIAYAMNFAGKQRRRPIEPILDRILRGHTPDALSKGEEMVRPPRRRGELGGTETT